MTISRGERANRVYAINVALVFHALTAVSCNLDQLRVLPNMATALSTPLTEYAAVCLKSLQ